MKIYFLISLISLFLLSSCQSPRKPKYWQLPLPAHLNSKQPAAFEAILPDSVRGKAVTGAGLFQAGDVAAFMVIPMPVSDIFPTIVTVDKNGNELDKLVLMMGNFGDAGDGWESSEDITILEDKTIVKIDSTYAYIGDSLGNIREDIRGLSVTTTKFRIADNGKIEKVEEKGL